MCNKWEEEWDRLDNMGQFTMEECSNKADEVADRDDDTDGTDDTDTDSNTDDD